MAKGQIKARIQCTVEIPVGTWGGGMTDMDKLTEQVRREGLETVTRMAKKEHGWVIGIPKVGFIVLNEEED